MINTSTVFILGAGASAPFQFETGEGLLISARKMALDTLADYIAPLPRSGAPPLYEALIHTGELSIDAMLESRPDIQSHGKALIARMLLNRERNALANHHASDRDWYGTLFSAMGAPTIEQALAQPVKFITYNYDRSLEYRLANAWRVKFDPNLLVDPQGIGQMFIHLHGQLGYLPEVGGLGPVVHYGGGEGGITNGDVLEASRAIKIVSEPHPDEPQFNAARSAISEAARVVFLGFGFGERNMERLQLYSGCMRRTTEIYVCRYGFSENQMELFINRPLQGFGELVIGGEKDDARELLRLHPQILI